MALTRLLGRPLARTADSGPAMARVIAFANQKGGVAKTTTTLNLGVALAEQGMRVLAVDLDPQGNLTMSQGWNPDEIDRSMFDVLVHRLPISEIVRTNELDAAVARPAHHQRARRGRRRDRARPVRVPVAARARPAREHALDDPREPQPERRHPGHPRDDVRPAAPPLARSGRDPEGELRRPRPQHEDPQDGALRGGAGEGAVDLQVRLDRRGSRD